MENQAHLQKLQAIIGQSASLALRHKYLPYFEAIESLAVDQVRISE